MEITTKGMTATKIPLMTTARRRLFKEVSMHYFCEKIALNVNFKSLHSNKTSKSISALTLKFSK